jgi:hypothetical protein
MGMLEQAGKFAGSLFGGIRADKRANDSQKDYWDRLQSLDTDYAQTVDSAPTFQVAESPVARAYLESFLTGSNPDAVMSTRHGSGAQEENARRNFERDFGGWEKLVREGNAERGDPSRFEVTRADPANWDVLSGSVDYGSANREGSKRTSFNDRRRDEYQEAAERAYKARG